MERVEGAWEIRDARCEIGERDGNVPDSRRGVEHLVVRTRQPTLLIRLTDVRHMRKHPLLDADLEQAHERGCRELDDERCSGRKLHVVAEFQVADKGGAFCECLDCVRLKDLLRIQN